MRRPKPRRVQRWDWLAYGLGLPMALLMLAPFLYMVATALLGEGDTLRRAHAASFAAALAAAPFGRFFLNSAIFSVAVAMGQEVTGTMAVDAYVMMVFRRSDLSYAGYR